MTFEEYLNWVDEDHRSEWVDGEAIVFMGATIRHLLLVGFFYNLLTNYLELRRAGLVFAERLDVRRVARGPIRQPDVAVVLNEHLDRLSRTELLGPADLIVEITSDESDDRDRHNKREEYAKLGVPEYWIVEGRDGLTGLECYELGLDRTYVRIEPDASGVVHSKVLPGFWFDPAWLDQEPLPAPIDLLRRIAGDALRERAGTREDA
jgi:Uma2 family endonuclease